MELLNNYNKTLPEFKKKNLGIFYTDQKLTKYIVERLNIKKDDTILDPSCGNGAFIFAVEDYLKKDFKIENVYGVDIDKKIIPLLQDELSKKFNSKIIKKNIINSDSINKDNSVFKHKKNGFNFIVGNPPYVNGKRNENYDFKLYSKYICGNVNLSMLLLIRSLNLLSDEGTLAFVMPKNLLHVEAYENIRKEILTNYTILEILDIGLYFKEVRGEQIVIFIKNKKPDSRSKISLRYLSNTKDFTIGEVLVNQSSFTSDNKIIAYRSHEEINIIKKLKSNLATLNDIVNGKIFRGIPVTTSNETNKAFRGRDIEKFGVKKHILAEPKDFARDREKIKMLFNKKIIMQNIFSSESGIIASYVDEDSLTTETVTNVVVKNETQGKYLLGLLNSKLLNYYLIVNEFNNSKMTMHTDKKYIGNIPIVLSKQYEKKLVALVSKAMGNKILNLKDILKEIDEYVYKIYDLNEKEIKTVENNIKNIYSEMWW